MSLKDTCVCAWDSVTVTISGGASLSNDVSLGGLRLFGVVMPASWTTANLTFLASFDNGTTWTPVKSMYDGTETTAVANAGGFYPLPDPRLFSSIPMIKIQSGLSASPVPQAGDRAIQLILRSI